MYSRKSVFNQSPSVIPSIDLNLFIQCHQCVSNLGREAHRQRRGPSHHFDFVRTSRSCAVCPKKIGSDFLSCKACSRVAEGFDMASIPSSISSKIKPLDYNSVLNALLRVLIQERIHPITVPRIYSNSSIGSQFQSPFDKHKSSPVLSLLTEKRTGCAVIVVHISAERHIGVSNARVMIW